MKFRRQSLIASAAAIVVALATVSYASASGPTGTGSARTASASASSAVAAKTQKKLTKAQKLKAALKKCKKQKSKAKRKACEKSARKKYKAKPKAKNEEPEEPETITPGTTTGGTTGGTTGTTTAGTTGTTATETPEQEIARAQTAAQEPLHVQIEAGKTIFESNCSGCHGPAGEGTPEAPALAKTERGQSIAGIIEQLVKPEGTMPDFDTSFTFEQKEDIADFVAVDITKVAVESH